MRFSQQLTRVDNSFDRDTLLDRLPELNTILDDDLREQTIDVLLRGTPDHFWTKPASTTGKYHHEDERGDHGQWLHVKRVYTVYMTLSRSFLEQHLVTEQQREWGKSAVCCHDMLKFGFLSENNEHTSANHDVLAADLARTNCLPKEVCDCIEAHNGAWGEGKLPESDLELLVHMADYVACKQFLGAPAVWRPHEQLTDTAPNLTRLSDDQMEKLL